MATIQKQKGVLERDDKDKIIMSLKNLITLCETDGLYEYPEMNNKIYLHFKGFSVIENLDTFVNLKTLYLENNLIAKIQGLEKLTQLTHLFLQHNVIKEIEGLEKNTALVNINLSHNLITEIKNLSHLDRLENLSIASNQLSDCASLAQLKDLPALSCCGLEDNRIGYDEKIFEDIFKQMRALKVLYLQGNDFGREFPYYRKRLIGSIVTLTYLDDRPVFPEERTLSEAFVEGGKEKMNAVMKEAAEKKQEIKREEQAANQKKSIEIKANRIVFFERNLKKGLIEIETLKKKLDRARLVGDTYMISQLEECLNKESTMATDIEETLGMMRKGLQQLLSAQQANSQNVVKQSVSSDSLFAKEDVEKLLLSLMHATTKEEDFTVENLEVALEKMIADIVVKILKEGEDINVIVRSAKEQISVSDAFQDFQTNNPNHLENLKRLRWNSEIQSRTITSDPHAHVDADIVDKPTAEVNQDYLDELE